MTPKKHEEMPEKFTSRIVFLIKPSERVGLDELAKKDKRDLTFLVREALISKYPSIFKE